MSRRRLLEEILRERMRQESLAFEGNTEEFDKTNRKNDWIAYIVAYAGRASDRVFSNQDDFHNNIVKVAALCLAALEAEEKEYI